MMNSFFKILFVVFFEAIVLGGVTLAAPQPLSKIEVSWQANREATVNKLGGGYYVYYSTASGFDLAKANKVQVPYVSGAKAPTSVVLSQLSPGTYYVKVVAYSALKAVSEPSKEVSFVVTP